MWVMLPEKITHPDGGLEMPHKLADNLLVWGHDIEVEALDQARVSASLPFIDGPVALMPDAHWGMGATVGSVIPTRGAIIPAAVGVDIGCGMIAVETNLNADELPDDLGPLLSSIEQAIPAGVGQGHATGDYLIEKSDSVVRLGLAERASKQMGTLGSGNHFVEVCLDADDTVWAVLHSGSRGVGNKLAMRHIKTAKGLMKRYFIDLPDADLAYFVEGTPEFGAYMKDLHWAQNYALMNRETMMDAVIAALQVHTKLEVTERRRINCHHNYTAREHHRGRDIWVTRKGAIRAREGDYGVIPGSMGTNSFIVKGLGNKASYDSSAHGAGRAMSRTQARKQFSEEDLADAMSGKVWVDNKGDALVDEIPGAYKDIDRVMAAQADLVEIEVELHQVLNYKGT